MFLGAEPNPGAFSRDFEGFWKELPASAFCAIVDCDRGVGGDKTTAQFEKEKACVLMAGFSHSWVSLPDLRFVLNRPYLGG